MAKKKQNNYKRVSKEFAQEEIDNYINEEFNNGWSIIFYNERIMDTKRAWVSIVFERKSRKIL